MLSAKAVANNASSFAVGTYAYRDNLLFPRNARKVSANSYTPCINNKGLNQVFGALNWLVVRLIEVLRAQPPPSIVELPTKLLQASQKHMVLFVEALL